MSTVEDIDFPPPEAAVPPPPSLATPAKRKKQQKRRSADADYDEAARTAPPTDAAAAAPVKATEASADDAAAPSHSLIARHRHERHERHEHRHHRHNFGGRRARTRSAPRDAAARQLPPGLSALGRLVPSDHSREVPSPCRARFVFLAMLSL